MDWLTFISSVIDQLISWPVAFVITVVLLLPQLKRLLPMLRHARVSRDEVELDFGERVDELEQSAEQAQLPPPEEIIGGPGDTRPGIEGASGRPQNEAERAPTVPPTYVYRLAEEYPPGAVVEAWKLVEREIRDLVERTDSSRLTSRAPIGRLLRALSDGDIVPPEIFSILNELRILRNRAVHDPHPEITALEALEYVNVALRTINFLRNVG